MLYRMYTFDFVGSSLKIFISSILCVSFYISKFRSRIVSIYVIITNKCVCENRGCYTVFVFHLIFLFRSVFPALCSGIFLVKSLFFGGDVQDAYIFISLVNCCIFRPSIAFFA